MSNKDMLKEVFNSVLKELHPKKIIENSCKFEDDVLYINEEKIDIPKDKKVYILGSGKAVLAMGEAIIKLLGNKIEKLLLVGAYENNIEYKNLEYIKSTHPLPSKNSISAANKIIELLSSLEKDDIFIYLLSGGNSALVELPQENITLKEFQKTTDLMIKGAMPIEAINCVRKHLSQVKGGRLGSFTKASGYVLTLSDVVGNDLQSIGSGPLYFDKTSFKDAISYLNEFEIYNLLDKSVQDFLNDGLLNKKEDTPKKEAKNIKHYILGSNEILLEKAKNILEQKDIKTTISNKIISNDVKLVCKDFLEFCSKKDIKEKECFIFGGEATVKVKGNGKGGRNQHLVLSFLNSFPKDKDITFLSAASDGIDGNSDASGAIVDKNSLKKAKDLNLDIKEYLKKFDSNSFFDKTNDLLIPGPTHNNMLDIVMILVDKNSSLGDK